MAPNTEDLRKAAFGAEKDLNSCQAKEVIRRKSDSTLETGVDEMVEKRFPESTVKYGPDAAPRRSDRRKVTEDEGATRDDRGRLPTAGQFEGEGGPETKIKIESENRPGDQDTLNLQEMKRNGLAG